MNKTEYDRWAHLIIGPAAAGSARPAPPSLNDTATSFRFLRVTAHKMWGVDNACGCIGNAWSATPPAHSACYQTEVAITDSTEAHAYHEHLTLTLKLLIAWVCIWMSDLKAKPSRTPPQLTEKMYIRASWTTARGIVVT